MQITQSKIISQLVSPINDWFDSLKLEELNGTKLYRWSPLDATPPIIQELLATLEIHTDELDTLKVEESQDRSTQSPHADTPPGYTTLVIPLAFRSPVATILYDAWYQGDFKKGYKHRPTGLTYYESEWLSTDVEKVEGIRGREFDKVFYQKWLDDYRYQDLYGLEVLSVNEWRLGSPIVFPGNQLHSGSKFNGSKKWCVIHHKSRHDHPTI